MPWTVPPRFEHALARPMVHKLSALFVVLALAAAHYYLSHLPLPQQIAGYNPVTAGANEVLLLDRPQPGTGPLLVYEGVLGETVDLYVTRGRLADTTRQQFARLGLQPPERSGPAHLVAEAAKGKTYFQIWFEPLASGRPRLYLSSPRQPGEDAQRLVLHPESARLTIKAESALPPTERSASGEKSLQIGDWSTPLPDPLPVSLIVEPGAQARLRFVGPESKDGLMDRLGFPPAESSAGKIMASSFGVRLADAARYTLYACAAATGRLLWQADVLQTGQCPDDRERLALSDFRLGSSGIALTASGAAWVQKDGAPATVDVVAWLKNNPVLAALIAAADAAVLGWCKRVFFG
jgi:hypothetical protein